jgi:uncharacterized protein (UPF0335 family)
MTTAVEHIRRIHDRFVNIMTEIGERQEDLRDLALEGKALGLNVPEIRKWAAATVKDKTVKRAADLADATLYAEALGVEIGVIPDREVAKPSVRSGSNVEARV